MTQKHIQTTVIATAVVAAIAGAAVFAILRRNADRMVRAAAGESRYERRHPRIR